MTADKYCYLYLQIFHKFYRNLFRVENLATFTVYKRLTVFEKKNCYEGFDLSAPIAEATFCQASDGLMTLGTYNEEVKVV